MKSSKVVIYGGIVWKNSFMNPKDVAKAILDNVMNYDNLNVADIIIERK